MNTLYAVGTVLALSMNGGSTIIPDGFFPYAFESIEECEVALANVRASQEIVFILNGYTMEASCQMMSEDDVEEFVLDYVDPVIVADYMEWFRQQIAN